MKQETNPTDVVLDGIDDKIKFLSDALVSGAAKSFEEYRCMCGEIKGLGTARNIITALVDSMEIDDE